MGKTPSWQANKDTAEYQEVELDVIEGELDMNLHLLREQSSGDGVLTAGLFKAAPKGGPAKIRYTFEGDETIYIVEGAVTIEILNGETHRVEAGDIASFSKGDTSIWTVEEPFQEVFVLSG